MNYASAFTTGGSPTSTRTDAEQSVDDELSLASLRDMKNVTLIGTGGSKKVYRGEIEGNEYAVAVIGESDESALKKEAQLTKDLSEDEEFGIHIPKFFELFESKSSQPWEESTFSQEDESTYFIMVMELCLADGEKYLKASPEPMHIHTIRAVLTQIVRTLHKAWGKMAFCHYDLKLLNVLLIPRPQEDLQCIPAVAEVQSDTPILLAKLCDFATSKMYSEEEVREGTPLPTVTTAQFTTLENTPPEYFFFGDDELQGPRHDEYNIALILLHFFFLKPYEEVLEDVKCPDILKEDLTNVWKTTTTRSYKVISDVIDTHGRDILCDTFYRWMVMFGVPEESEDLEGNPVWTLIWRRDEDYSKKYKDHCAQFSLKNGIDKRIEAARNGLTQLRPSAGEQYGGSNGLDLVCELGSCNLGARQPWERLRGFFEEGSCTTPADAFGSSDTLTPMATDNHMVQEDIGPMGVAEIRERNDNLQKMCQNLFPPSNRMSTESETTADDDTSASVDTMYTQEKFSRRTTQSSANIVTDTTISPGAFHEEASTTSSINAVDHSAATDHQKNTIPGVIVQLAAIGDKLNVFDHSAATDNDTIPEIIGQLATWQKEENFVVMRIEKNYYVDAGNKRSAQAQSYNFARKKGPLEYMLLDNSSITLSEAQAKDVFAVKIDRKEGIIKGQGEDAQVFAHFGVKPLAVGDLVSIIGRIEDGYEAPGYFLARVVAANADFFDAMLHVNGKLVTGVPVEGNPYFLLMERTEQGQENVEFLEGAKVSVEFQYTKWRKKSVTGIVGKKLMGPSWKIEGDLGLKLEWPNVFECHIQHIKTTYKKEEVEWTKWIDSLQKAWRER